MEFFTKYKTAAAAALADVAPGACIVLPHFLGAGEGREILVALKIAHAEGEQRSVFGPRSALIALWSNKRSPFSPSLLLVEDTVEALEIPGAGAHISSDPAHIDFGAPSVGALYLFGGQPHVSVEDGRGGRGLIWVRLTDGARDGRPKGDVPWFPVWAVTVPDTNGRMAP